MSTHEGDRLLFLWYWEDCLKHRYLPLCVPIGRSICIDEHGLYEMTMVYYLVFFLDLSTMLLFSKVYHISVLLPNTSVHEFNTYLLTETCL